MPQRLHGRLTRVALTGLALDVALLLAARLPWIPSTGISLPGFQPTALAFSPDGALLAVGLRTDRSQGRSLRGRVALLAPQSGVRPRVVGDFAAGVWALAFSPDGQTLALATEAGDVALLDVSTGKVKRRIGGAPRDARPPTLAFSPEGRWLAIARETAVGLVSLGDGRSLRLPIDGGKDRPTALAFSSDGAWLAGGGHRGPTRFWSLAGDVSRPTVLAQPADALSFSPDGRCFALFSSLAGAVEMRTAGGTRKGPWERRLGVRGHHLEWEEIPGSARLWSQWMPDGDARTDALAFSPDGALLACGEAQQATLLRAADGEVVRRQFVPGFTGSLAFSPDGRTIALRCRDRVALWRL